MSKAVRCIVGFFVGFFGWMTRPAQIQRSEQDRKMLAHAVKGLRIYDYKGCPRSLKLRHTLHRLNLDIQYCDISSSQIHQNNLLTQYGRLHAPCLRIEENQTVQWLDDSRQIIQYLNQRFDTAVIERLPA
jgi:glutaredoxin